MLTHLEDEYAEKVSKFRKEIAALRRQCDNVDVEMVGEYFKLRKQVADANEKADKAQAEARRARKDQSAAAAQVQEYEVAQKALKALEKKLKNSLPMVQAYYDTKESHETEIEELAKAIDNRRIDVFGTEPNKFPPIERPSLTHALEPGVLTSTPVKQKMKDSGEDSNQPSTSSARFEPPSEGSSKSFDHSF